MYLDILKMNPIATDAMKSIIYKETIENIAFNGYTMLADQSLFGVSCYINYLL